MKEVKELFTPSVHVVNSFRRPLEGHMSSSFLSTRNWLSIYFFLCSLLISLALFNYSPKNDIDIYSYKPNLPIERTSPISFTANINTNAA